MGEKNHKSQVRTVDTKHIVDHLFKQKSVEDMLQVLVNNVAYFFPEAENISTRIVLNDQVYISSDFQENHFISSDILINGVKEGSIAITVNDIDNCSNSDLNLSEYKKTLNTISGIAAVAIEKVKELNPSKRETATSCYCCNLLDDYIFVLDKSCNIIDSNSSFEKCTGYSSSQLSKMNMKDIFSQSENNHSAMKKILKAFDKGNCEFEIENKCMDGEYVTLSVKCKPFKHKDNACLFCVAKDISKRKIAECELKKSEKKYSTLVKKGNDGIVILVDGVIKFANNSIIDIAGYGLTELEGKDFLRLLNPIDHDRYLDWIKTSYRNGPGEDLFNVNFLKDNGYYIPVEICASFIDYEDKEALLLIIRDISERIESEKFLQMERDRLLNYLDVAGSIIGIVDNNAKIIFVNKKGTQILGYKNKEEIIGKDWFYDFLPERLQNITKDMFKKVMNNEVDPPPYFENYIRTKQGEERLIFWHDVPLEDENGRRTGMISSGEDITENRKMEAMLMESEKNLKTIFDHVNDQIYIYRPYGNFIDVNQELLNSTGYTKEEMLGMNPKDLLLPEEKYLKDIYTERVLEENNCIFEIAHINKIGELVQLEINARLIDYKGEKAILSVARNITERKKAEESLKIYACELKKSNEHKELFTDIIRHDLLTPASVVKGYTEELLHNIKDEQVIWLAEKIRDNNDRLIDLLETATKLAKLEKEEDIVFERMDIQAVFKNVASVFKDQLDMKEQELLFSEERHCLALVNPVIEEVFSNLLSNAIKYSPPKSKIEIIFEEEQDRWRICVIDYGIGITNNDKKLLFNRFHRADKAGIKGSGLGLAIVKRVIELHDGEYGVKDNPSGKGSVFWVTVKKE